jgi:hypothetical protein
MKTKRQKDAKNQTLLFDAERVCLGCRRWLRGDRSIRRSYGPVCWRRHKAEIETEKATKGD